MSEAAVRFVRTIRHIPPAQLGARFWLSTKRAAVSRFATSGFKGGRALVATVPELASILPISPFPRSVDDRIKFSGGEPTVDLVGTSWPIHPPVQWHGGMLEVGTRLEKLHLHYHDYLESADDDLFAAVIDDWIDHNPPYTDDYWRHNWNSYALSIRVVTWMQELAKRHGRFPEARVERWLRSLAAQMRFLRRNIEQDVRGNHIIRNIRALLWGGAFFCGREADQARTLGLALLTRELDVQFLGDGFHFERSPSYHAQVLGDLIDCRVVLNPGSIRDRVDTLLGQMCSALARLTHPDGTPALFNDGGLGMARAPAELIAAAGSFVSVAPVERGAFTLPEAGYFGIRTAEEYFVADCGVLCPDSLPAHAHADILSFEWSVGAHRIVVDQGVYEYHEGERRRRSREVQTHNTVAVAGGDQAEFWASFRVGRRPSVSMDRWTAKREGIHLVGSHDGFSVLPGHPIHRRTFDVRQCVLAVVDSVVGGVGQSVTAGILLHPDVEVHVQGKAVQLTAGAETIMVEANCPMDVLDAVWWPDLGVEVPTIRLVLRYGSAPCEGSFTLTRTT
jgi:uncharacterized heparinase superfamily protein